MYKRQFYEIANRIESKNRFVSVNLIELVHDRIVEQGTEIVDPETPVDCSRLWALVTWNAGNPGVGPGSLLFLEAESWACQVTEIVVPVAGK